MGMTNLLGAYYSLRYYQIFHSIFGPLLVYLSIGAERKTRY